MDTTTKPALRTDRDSLCPKCAPGENLSERVANAEKRGSLCRGCGARVKLALPDDVAKEMDAWRLGHPLADLNGYIDFHRALAEQMLDAYRLAGHRITDVRMASDGWFDGMRVLHATLDGIEVKWDDGSQQFYAHHHGWTPLSLHIAALAKGRR